MLSTCLSAYNELSRGSSWQQKSSLHFNQDLGYRGVWRACLARAITATASCSALAVNEAAPSPPPAPPPRPPRREEMADARLTASSLPEPAAALRAVSRASRIEAARCAIAIALTSSRCVGRPVATLAPCWVRGDCPVGVAVWPRCCCCCNALAWLLRDAEVTGRDGAEVQDMSMPADRLSRPGLPTVRCTKAK